MSGEATAKAIWEIAHIAARARRVELQAAFVEQCGWGVQSGPFMGMVLPDRSYQGDGDTLPKLIGCYEAELHDVLESLPQQQPGLVVNVGADEGYYAIGLARLLPEAFVHAFDSAEQGADICREAARLNGVEARVSVAGACSPVLLQHLLVRATRPVLLCDCEGYERELIDPGQVPALAGTTMVVECHDFIDAAITQTLVNRLTSTHEMFAVREGARDPNVVPFLQQLSSVDRWIAVCEYRPSTMHWLIARPKLAG